MATPDSTCTLDGCDKPAVRNKRTTPICEMHYNRIRRHGGQDATSVIVGDDVARFWSRVDKRGPGECWEWQGALNNGYGSFRVQGRTMGAHLFSYQHATGQARPDGMDTCHTCDNRKCVNPAHLYWGTRQQNIDDAWNRDRMPYGEDHLRAKVTDRDVVALRHEYADGAAVSDLSQTYGLAESTVRCIVLGLKWKRVGGPITRRRSNNRKKVA